MNNGPSCPNCWCGWRRLERGAVVVDGGGARGSTRREAVDRAAEAGAEGGTDSHGAGEARH